MKELREYSLAHKNVRGDARRVVKAGSFLALNVSAPRNLSPASTHLVTFPTRSISTLNFPFQAYPINFHFLLFSALSSSPWPINKGF